MAPSHDIRERLEAFWAGEQPGLIPFTIYQNEWRHTQDDPAWGDLLARGMGVTWHVSTVEQVPSTDIQFSRETRAADDQVLERRCIRTPLGEIEERYADGWRREFYLKSAVDYAVMRYVVEHTALQPDYDTYWGRVAQIGPHAVALVMLGRTPLQTILVDWVGVEQFGLHLADMRDEMMALYEALLVSFRRRTELAAEGPGRFVSVLENFTSDTLGPRRYRELLLPVYEECFPMLREAGKVVGTHYDGQLAACAGLIAQAPIDAIESFTPPPEGDMTLAEARAIWPEKLLWSNINVACYNMPADELKALVWRRIAEGASDGRRLAFEVSEQYPENWRTSLHIVLDALEEART
ncbi:MAG: hypothetical protein ACOX2R_12095 [Anaerolineae bacterium]